MERVYLDVTPVNIITVGLMVLVGGFFIGALANFLKGYVSSRGAAQ